MIFRSLSSALPLPQLDPARCHIRCGRLVDDVDNHFDRGSYLHRDDDGLAVSGGERYGCQSISTDRCQPVALIPLER